VKKSSFLRTAAHIFVSPRDVPATITQYVVWMKSKQWLMLWRSRSCMKISGELIPNLSRQWLYPTSSRRIRCTCSWQCELILPVLQGTHLHGVVMDDLKISKLVWFRLHFFNRDLECSDPNFYFTAYNTSATHACYSEQMFPESKCSTKNFEDMFIHLCVCVHSSDWWTDRQTDTMWQQRPRLCIASCGKNPPGNEFPSDSSVV